MRSRQFVHTSDVHLDTSFAASGLPSRLGDRKREAIRGTFRHILEQAREKRADLVLIAGDLFEHDRVTADTIEFLKQQFENLGDIRVFIAPGNHDPFIQGSPYREESWPGNVHIFRTEEFQSVDLQHIGVRVTGFAFNRTRLEDRPFLKLAPLPNDRFNIVLSHGSDIQCIPTGKLSHGPFSIEEIAGKNIHYCALGHYHQQRPVFNPIDQTPVWYPGIPEGRGWDEQGSCGYLSGEIWEGGVRIEGCACNQYPLHTMSVDCEAFSSREQILDAIREQGGSALSPKTILRVRLTGYLDPKLDLSKTELEERLADELLHVQWDDQTVPAIDFESVAQERSLRGRFVRHLNELIQSASEDERLVLQRARHYGIQALLGREPRLQ